MPNDYSDILHLPHPISKTHPRMSMHQRAAQFAPFAALTGHNDMIAETARLTDTAPTFDDERNRILNQKMAYLQERFSERPVLSFTYFEPDANKTGGAYRNAKGIVKKIDVFTMTVVMEEGEIIPIHAIFDIEGELFENLFFD